MEKDFYHIDFEELIREKADQYKMYPSEKVWKGIDRSLRSKRKWYWTGFVLLLTGVSYFAINELVSTSPAVIAVKPAIEIKPELTTAELVPFSSNIDEISSGDLTNNEETITSDLYVEDSGNITAAFQIPLKLLPGNASANADQTTSFLISGLEPLTNRESYNIELSWPVDESGNATNDFTPPSPDRRPILRPTTSASKPSKEINWYENVMNRRLPVTPPGRVSWQLAFSPTVNYRKLTGKAGSRNLSNTQTIPMAVQIDGDVDKFVNHKPALGFELGTHASLKLNRRISLKGGIQFNYSKYDIRAFKTPTERTTIALNSSLPNTPGAIIGYSDLRNFGGSSVEDLKNQYFQLSMPVGFEVRVFGSDKLQFNLASTIQPTYLLNKNTYLITTDLKNYTKEPSLVRRWNVNAGAEAYVSYTRGDVKWQVGPQFRYQLLSSYQKVYPIKEYLMEYGIKVGITKTIR